MAHVTLRPGAPATQTNTVPGGASAARKTHRYGWVPDLPDARDVMYAAPYEQTTNLPPSADLRQRCPDVYDQGSLGSCTANAIAAAVEFIHDPRFMPSRLFIYYNERTIEGTVGSDSGAQIRDGIKSVATQGVCPETEWPYDPAQFAAPPPAAAYGDALATKATRYYRVVQDLAQMRGCLAENFPFVFGFTVYDSFESEAMAASGELHLPARGEKVVGGHAVMAVGYDDASQNVIVRNSWGPAWGKAGYFTMPYAYISSRQLASDFWTIRQET